jgi:pimeloyl-ACP methyl ester carboxylesterase
MQTPGADPPAWQAVPSTYIICTDDQILPAQAQEGMARHARDSHHIDSDHSPFLSCPERLAALFNDIAQGI